jgi:1-acyl-sn-glycerol-3-phosphate acyltransferase
VSRRVRAQAARTGAFLAEAPTTPGGVEPRTPERTTGVDYDTAWSRRYGVRLARAVLLDDVARLLVWLALSPKVIGLEHLGPIDTPVILTANHASHIDSGLLISSLPVNIRHKIVLAAAADYFFDRRWKAAMWSFSLGAIPMERTKVNRRSADLAASLIEDGWNLLIFPEGGRTPDGWGQEFKGGAAYLAKRCNVPVVPVHLRGTRAVLAKGSSTVRPGTTEIRIGDPLWPGEDEDARRFATRIELAVAALSDEAETDWWSARRRAAAGTTPAFRGADASPWRRAWELPESARKDQRRRRAVRDGKPWRPID